jgi:hypothetical protein
MDAKTYAKYEKQILDAIQKLEDDKYFVNEHDKNFLVPNVFVTIPAQSNPNFYVSGSGIPMVVAISSETGRAYFFELKRLVPEVYKELYGDG